MKRRDFIALLGSAAAATSSFAARAQQKRPVIGFLSNSVPGPNLDDDLAAFRDGLKEHGYVEGQNVVIEFRWAHGRNDRLPALAAELVQRDVALIATSGGDPSARAAKAATQAIPVIFVTSNDPVKSGFVASLNKPGGNLTGVYRLSSELLPKALELLCEVVPQAGEIAFLVNHTNPNTASFSAIVEAAAQKLGRRIKLFKAGTDGEIDRAFADMVAERIGALQIGNDPFFSSRAKRLGDLALRHKIPATYAPPDFVAGGGLMRYGDNLADAYRLLGVYSGRILKGEKPSELPVQQQSRFEFAINLRTAKALGVTIPLPLVGRADRVIE
jgi:putative ABC transport system substrate-binding protein